MSELEEVTMTFIPLVKRDHPRWPTNRCRIEAKKLAKKFMAEPRKRMDWSKVELVNEQCDITSKRLRAF